MPGVASRGFSTAILLLGCSLPAAWACNTPVYRYAMYNWAPAPYRVFYFHGGRPAEEDDAVNQMLDGLLDAEPAAANVMFRAVDVSQQELLEQLPDVVNQARQADADGSNPLHVVFSPWGVKLFSGRLDSETVQAMVDSPVRQRLGQLLEEGNAAVLLVLAGPNEKANVEAEKVAAEVVADAASGGIPTVSPAGDIPAAAFLPDPPGSPSDDDARDEASGGLRLAVLKLSRTDPAEQWLVRCLLSVEPDLDEYAAEPMVFAVYGRGRTMPPYVGKGITVENLTECAVFLAGACSCMVKEENPGMDLLVRRDWEAVADKMAGQEEDLGGGLLGYQEFTPADSGNWTEVSAAQDPTTEVPITEIPAAEEPQPEAPVAASARGVPVQATETAGAPNRLRGRDRAQTGPGSFAARQAWKLGIALAAGAICVLTAGLVLLRRQRPA